MTELQKDIESLLKKFNLINALLLTAAVYLNTYFYFWGYLAFYNIDKSFVSLSSNSIIEAGIATSIFDFIAVSLAFFLIASMMPSVKAEASKTARYVTTAVIIGIAGFFAYSMTKGTSLEGGFTGYAVGAVTIIVIIALLVVGVELAVFSVRLASCLMRKRPISRELFTRRLKPESRPDDEPNVVSLIFYTLYLFPLLGFTIGQFTAAHTYKLQAIRNDGALYAVIQTRDDGYITKLYDSKTKKLDRSHTVVIKQPSISELEIVSISP